MVGFQMPGAQERWSGAARPGKPAFLDKPNYDQMETISVNQLKGMQPTLKADGSPDWANMSKAEGLQRFFDTPKNGIKQSASEAYNREHLNLSDAFHGHNESLSRLMILNITDTDQWMITDVMPWHWMDGSTTFEYNSWTFHDSAPVVEPEEGMARYAVSNRESFKVSMKRFGMAAEVEIGFFRTDMGRIEWHFKLIQIENGVLEAACMGALNEVIHAPRYVEKYRAFRSTRSIQNNIMDRLSSEREDTFAINKDQDAFFRLVARMQGEMSTRANGGGDANLLIVPQRLKAFVSEMPQGLDQTGAARGRPTSNILFDAATTGLTVRASRPFRLGDMRAELDIMSNEATISGYMYVSRHLLLDQNITPDEWRNNMLDYKAHTTVQGSNSEIRKAQYLPQLFNSGVFSKGWKKGTLFDQTIGLDMYMAKQLQEGGDLEFVLDRIQTLPDDIYTELVEVILAALKSQAKTALSDRAKLPADVVNRLNGGNNGGGGSAMQIVHDDDEKMDLGADNGLRKIQDKLQALEKKERQPKGVVPDWESKLTGDVKDRETDPNSITCTIITPVVVGKPVKLQAGSLLPFLRTHIGLVELESSGLAAYISSPLIPTITSTDVQILRVHLLIVCFIQLFADKNTPINEELFKESKQLLLDDVHADFAQVQKHAATFKDSLKTRTSVVPSGVGDPVLVELLTVGVAFVNLLAEPTANLQKLKDCCSLIQQLKIRYTHAVLWDGAVSPDSMPITIVDALKNATSKLKAGVYTQASSLKLANKTTLTTPVEQSIDVLMQSISKLVSLHGHLYYKYNVVHLFYLGKLLFGFATQYNANPQLMHVITQIVSRYLQYPTGFVAQKLATADSSENETNLITWYSKHAESLWNYGIDLQAVAAEEAAEMANSIRNGYYRNTLTSRGVDQVNQAVVDIKPTNLMQRDAMYEIYCASAVNLPVNLKGELVVDEAFVQAESKRIRKFALKDIKNIYLYFYIIFRRFNGAADEWVAADVFAVWADILEYKQIEPVVASAEILDMIISTNVIKDDDSQIIRTLAPGVVDQTLVYNAVNYLAGHSRYPVSRRNTSKSVAELRQAKELFQPTTTKVEKWSRKEWTSILSVLRNDHTTTVYPVWFEKANLPIGLSTYGFRPTQTFKVSGPILTYSGGRVGKSLIAFPDMMVGDNMGIKMHYAHFSYYYRPVVLESGCIVYAPNAFCEDYIGGHDLTMWDASNPGHQDKYKKGLTIASMFVQIERSNKGPNEECRVVDLTDDFHPNVKKGIEMDIQRVDNYRTWSKVYNKHWGYPVAATARSDPTVPQQLKFDSLRANSKRWNNKSTICFPEHQQLYSHRYPGGDKWMDKQQFRLNQGHWGESIYPGCDRVWRGKESCLKPTNYHDLSMVTVMPRGVAY